MSREQLSVFDAPLEGIAARCNGCGFRWVGRDAIRAPSLAGCRCFWCAGELVEFAGATEAGWLDGPKGPRASKAERCRRTVNAFVGKVLYP